MWLTRKKEPKHMSRFFINIAYNYTKFNGIIALIRTLQMISKIIEMAPQVGFEPTTYRLTAECSTVELLRKIFLIIA